MLPHTHPSLVHFFKDQCYLLSVKTQKPPRHLQYTSTYVTSLTTVEHEQLPCSVVLMDTFQTHCPKYNPTRHTHALWSSNSWPRNGGVLPLFGPFGVRRNEPDRTRGQDHLREAHHSSAWVVWAPEAISVTLQLALAAA